MRIGRMKIIMAFIPFQESHVCGTRVLPYRPKYHPTLAFARAPCSFFLNGLSSCPRKEDWISLNYSSHRSFEMRID